jgi:hypothetical protein
MFDYDGTPKISLNDFSKLGNPEFSVPFSIVYGDDDWMVGYDDGCSKKLI